MTAWDSARLVTTGSISKWCGSPSSGLLLNPERFRLSLKLVLSNPGVYENMLEDLTKSMFAENVNSTFNLRHGAGQPLALELVELREAAPQSDYERFSLFFRGP